ncbi:MAG: serine/threonine protein kinase, partial [Myxococcales bacterium]|nr:serine/threonine protein kinase [Myxococcales bacterium]
GVFHRDLKPSNIMVTSLEPSSPRVKVADFGLAKLDRGLSHSSEHLRRLNHQQVSADWARVGSPGYMAPEQVTSSAIDGRTDLYALGVILFEMLTGRTPFEFTDKNEFFDAHLHLVPPTLISIRPGVPDGLSDLVAELLEKDPERRPPDAQSVLERLRAIEEKLEESADSLFTDHDEVKEAPPAERRGSNLDNLDTAAHMAALNPRRRTALIILTLALSIGALVALAVVLFGG